MSLFSEASEVIAGGVNSPVRAFAGVGGEPVLPTPAPGVEDAAVPEDVSADASADAADSDLAAPGGNGSGNGSAADANGTLTPTGKDDHGPKMKPADDGETAPDQITP